MTWLPISLKNAVKCDKWYELQNHLITESLNANGAWVIPVHAIFSVSNVKTNTHAALCAVRRSRKRVRRPAQTRRADMFANG
eukprot:gene11511-gene9326